MAVLRKIIETNVKGLRGKSMPVQKTGEKKAAKKAKK